MKITIDIDDKLVERMLRILAGRGLEVKTPKFRKLAIQYLVELHLKYPEYEQVSIARYMNDNELAELVKIFKDNE